jgi:hypothetical protein
MSVAGLVRVSGGFDNCPEVAFRILNIVERTSQLVVVQRRRSRAEAAQLVAEYEGSGLSRVEFCRKQGLSVATPARYRKRQAIPTDWPGRAALYVSASRSMVRATVSFALTVNTSLCWASIGIISLPSKLGV